MRCLLRASSFAAASLWVAFITFAGPGAAESGEKPAPLSRVDRTKVVGSPVLDGDAAEGVYLWIEDGAFRVAAVSRAKHPQTITVKVSSTKPVKVSSEEDFRGRTLGKTTVLTARVKTAVAHGAFETEGDVTVTRPVARPKSRAVPLFLGPLARPAAKSVRIGRY